MHSRFRMKGVLLVALLAMLASAAAPNVASAGPQPGAPGKKGFRLFARALGALVINRVYCGLSSDGQVCVDSTGSSTIGGGFWPKGTADQYVFNSGLQLAGVIGPDGGPWAGDTTGAFFFDPKGTTQHGEEVQPIYNSTSATDTSSWPGAACVPNGAQHNDSSAVLFDPLLWSDPNGPTKGGVTNCRLSASQGDLWFMSWEGNPTQKAGRKHPLGVAVETRGMGWNFPSGNEDIIYYIYTFYNISTSSTADYISHGIRPSLASILAQKGQDFKDENRAVGVTLPAGGYTITNLFAAFAADMDVANASNNYSSVNLPFALGYIYANDFLGAPGWTFDNSIFGAPFFSGAGFVGVKYLKSPTGPGAIQLFSNTINGAPFAGAVNDPRDVFQLYRYLSGTLSPATGDQPCNTGTPSTTHICYVNNTDKTDMRFFQSSTPLTLAPGEGGSIVVAYIFAAPVGVGGCNGGAPCDVKPGNALKLTNAATLGLSGPGNGANTVDSITGFKGYSDANGDGVVQQNEMTVVPGSLLGKSLVAQAVFDGKFLLPFAPSSPDFFLIPGDNQTTVLWKPSASETSGDPFFSLAAQPTVFDPVTSTQIPNKLYDPNYRNFDVEGYRIYRGRVDAPNELTLLAQYDYSGTSMEDFTGVINPNPNCAPEIIIPVVLADPVTLGCPVLFADSGNQKNGIALTTSTSYPLVGDVIQLSVTGATKGRALLANNTALIVKADTAVVGGAKRGGCGPKSACPALDDTGVPFVYVDRSPRNNFRYFYSVTAFDINSVESGPTSLESPRNTKSVTPVRPATNYSSSGTVTLHVVGRGVAMDTIITSDPTINASGQFSGPQRPANGLVAAFVGQLPTKVLNGQGAFEVTLDSIDGGEADESGCCGGVAAGTVTTYFMTAQSGAVVTKIQVPVTVNGNDDGSAGGGAFFSATAVNDSLAGLYGGNSSFLLKGTAADTIPSLFLSGALGLGCRLGGANIPADCIYNGPRWFDGPSAPTSSPLPSARILPETKVDPNGGNCPFPNTTGPTCVAVDFNNGGGLSGVATINVPQSYTQLIRRWRNMESSLGPVFRAADMNVYWGAAGRIDSVIDITHNVPIPDAFIRDTTYDSLDVSATPDTFISVTRANPAKPRPFGANWSTVNVANTNAAGSNDTRPTVLTVNDLACFEPFRSIHVSPGLQYHCTNSSTPFTPGAMFTSDTVAVPGAVAFYQDAQANAITAPVAANNGFGLYISGTYTQFELTGGAVPASGTVWTLRTYSGMIGGGNGAGGGNTGVPYSFYQSLRPFTAVGAKLQVAFDVANTVAAPTSADLKQVHTVPDPYYVTNEFEQSTDNKIIKFVNLPQRAIIRIYSSSGVLVQVLEHNSTTNGGDQTWNVRNRNNQVVASGVYFYHIEANGSGGSARRVGRMTIVNFAQ